jgi:hypothetical protein
MCNMIIYRFFFQFHFMMIKKKRTKVTINTRVEENRGEFRVDNGILFYNFCDHSVDWMQNFNG